MEGCPSSQQYHEEDSYIICHQCGGRTCTSCDIPWHPDLSCAEVVSRRAQAQAADEASSKYLSSHTKLCPNCGIRGTKVKGCDHMTCKSSTFFRISSPLTFDSLENEAHAAVTNTAGSVWQTMDRSAAWATPPTTVAAGIIATTSPAA